MRAHLLLLMKKERELIEHAQRTGEEIEIKRRARMAMPARTRVAGVAKIKLALARGKRQRDKREDIKRREADREVERALKKR